MKENKEKNITHVSIYLDKEFLNKIDNMAEELDLSRNQLLTNFIKLSYEDAVILKKIGMLGAALLGRKLIDKIKADYLPKKNLDGKKP